MNQLNRIC